MGPGRWAGGDITACCGGAGNGMEQRWGTAGMPSSLSAPLPPLFAAAEPCPLLPTPPWAARLHGQVEAGGGGVQGDAQVCGSQQAGVVLGLQPQRPARREAGGAHTRMGASRMGARNGQRQRAAERGTSGPCLRRAHSRRLGSSRGDGRTGPALHSARYRTRRSELHTAAQYTTICPPECHMAQVHARHALLIFCPLRPAPRHQKQEARVDGGAAGAPH